MSVMKNAVDSIALGVEDFTSPDPRRALSSVRNLFVGIILLFKEKLIQLSPPGSDEALIKQRLLPELGADGKVTWKGSGKKTADVEQIKERLTALGIKVEWARVNKINQYRNEIEHYFSSQAPNSVRAMVTDSFLVVRDFIRDHLNEDPLDLLGPDTWNTLSQVAEVYQKEKDECRQQIVAAKLAYPVLEEAIIEFRCSGCGSGLIEITAIGTQVPSENTFRCRNCGQAWEYDEIAEEAIAARFSYDDFLAVKDGGDPSTIECPSCGRTTYLLDQNECVNCGESLERVCWRCGDTIPIEELDGGDMCGYCAHIMSKDD